MRRLFRFILPVGLLALLAMPGPAGAEHGTNPVEMSPNMFHSANRPPTPPSGPAATNSDIAFWQGGAVGARNQDLVAAGNYWGFRLFNVNDPENPVEVANVRCRANQGDLSFYQAQNRLLLIQSIDRPVTTSDCATAVDTPVSGPFPEPPVTRFAFGFEGLRVFDVTRPEAPVHIASVATACGSHTHTTIPDTDNQRAIVYVSSYPIGASVSPPVPQPGDVGPRCTQPHAKITIVEIPDKAPETARVLKEQPLDADTKPFRGTLGSGGTGAIGCHDITTLTEASQSPESDPRPRRETAAAACLEEGQLWDISDPADPQTIGAGHSHIYNPAITPANPAAGGLFHTASFTWDGEIILFTDEWQGGGAHGCDGPQDTRGNVWFYKAVPPGTPNVPVLGRYMMPRAQPAGEICTLHNGNVIPTNDGYFGVSSSYEGGTSVFDFTGVEDLPEIPSPPHGAPFPTPPPLAAREVAWADLQGADGRTKDDTWSSYWYNDYIWVNGGLDRTTPGTPVATRRGFDVFKILLPQGKTLGDPIEPGDEFTTQYRARKHGGENPQTQEVWQGTGWGQGDQTG
jgi:hypothetical protein